MRRRRRGRRPPLPGRGRRPGWEWNEGPGATGRPAMTVAAAVVDALAGDAAVLEIGVRRLFRYESVYFDTPDLESYLAAARRRRRRSLTHPPTRAADRDYSTSVSRPVSTS